jgi:hypothetical protein
MVIICDMNIVTAAWGEVQRGEKMKTKNLLTAKHPMFCAEMSFKRLLTIHLIKFILNLVEMANHVSGEF